MDATLSRFLRWIDARHGVCHTSDARADGIPSGAIAAAIEQGLVARVRRSWLVTAGCDPRRRAAASVSGRVTCVTAAGLCGLWVPHDTAAELHLAVSHNAARLPREGMHLHWGQGPAPVGRNTVDDHILNVLFQTAGCLGRREALPIWQSAAARGHVDPAELVRVAWRSREARALAAATSTLSDSGIETVFVTGMDAEGVAVRQQVWVDGHPLDGLIGDRLGIQLDGFAHHRAAQRRRDLRADARLALRGFTLLRFDYQQVMFDWDHVRSTVLMAMAQGLHRAR